MWKITTRSIDGEGWQTSERKPGTGERERNSFVHDKCTFFNNDISAEKHTQPAFPRRRKHAMKNLCIYRIGFTDRKKEEKMASSWQWRLIFFQHPLFFSSHLIKFRPIRSVPGGGWWLNFIFTGTSKRSKAASHRGRLLFLSIFLLPPKSCLKKSRNGTSLDYLLKGTHCSLWRSTWHITKIKK